jgi:hypothetical protein
MGTDPNPSIQEGMFDAQRPHGSKKARPWIGLAVSAGFFLLVVLFALLFSFNSAGAVALRPEVISFVMGTSTSTPTITSKPTPVPPTATATATRTFEPTVTFTSTKLVTQTPSGTADPKHASILTQTAVKAQELTLTATFKPIPSHTPSPTVTPVLGVQLETPFGPTNAYLVHRVAPGESLEMLATMYKTTQDVICAVNGRNGDRHLYADEYVVILPGKMDLVNLVAVKPVYVEQSKSVKDLAAELKVDEGTLREMNGIEGEWVEAERWVVVVR